jgi:IS30 family transposase
MEYYTHLINDERVRISIMKQEGLSVRQIAMKLNRSPSTISRELRRNQAPPGHYWPDTAEHLSKARRRRGCKLNHFKALSSFVIERLSCHLWSPEQIAAYLKYRQVELPYVCHETIYAWIYSASQKAEKWYQYLTRHKRKRGLRKSRGVNESRIKERVSIHERPHLINKNKTFGHWEADLMSCQKNKQFMLVLRERLTMYVKSVRLINKTAEVTNRAIIDLMADLPAQARQSITYDNGTEFAFHAKVKETLKGIQTYFCDPYSPWQKGRVENSNGRLRKDFPRKLDLQKLTDEDFNESIENYNLTPRKGLKWFTPDEVFQKNVNRVALQT